MLFDSENFKLKLGDVDILVKEHVIGEAKVFRINFSDKRAPLNIHRVSAGGVKTWMSIPQGRQKEAEQIGSLISDHFKTK